MNTFNGYINYGCLAAEKRPVYTAGMPASTAVVSDAVVYTVPDGWTLDETASGAEIITAPWGWTYTPNDLLGGKENPCFEGYDKDGNRFSITLDYKLV